MGPENVMGGHHAKHCLHGEAEARRESGFVRLALLLLLTQGLLSRAQTAEQTPKDAPQSKPAAATSAKPAMEFSDKPNFAVAGVTDWTAVGGHGADTVLRTSEDLARETLALPAHDEPDPGSAANRAATEALLRAAVVAAPQSLTANRDLGEFYVHTSQFGKALSPLQTARGLSTDDARSEYDLALACQGLGDIAEARAHVQRALELKEAAEFHRLAGELAESAGDPLEAVRQQQRAVQLEPSEPNYFAWGSELLLHRAIWQAAEVFAKGVQAHPASVRLRTAWGAALFSGSLYAEAAQRLCEASDLDPAAAEPYLFLGKVALAAPEPLRCVQAHLARFAERSPQNAGAQFSYAMSLLAQGGAAERSHAEALLTRAAALDPRSADAFLQLGILAFGQKKYPEAVSFYEQAIRANPQDAEAHYRLGVAYDRAGEPEKARQELALHHKLQQAQAEAVEQQRRQIKQFQIVLSGEAPHAVAP